MASKTERTVVNAAGLVQSIVLVTFPAASTIFTSKSEYGLSSSQYATAVTHTWGIGASSPAGATSRHMIAIGLTGEPVPVGRRSGAMTHRNDQRPSRSHSGASSPNWR